MKNNIQKSSIKPGIYLFITLTAVISSCSMRSYISTPIPYTMFDTSKQVSVGANVGINMLAANASYALTKKVLVHGSYVGNIGIGETNSFFSIPGGRSQKWEAGLGLYNNKNTFKRALTLSAGHGSSQL